MKNTAEKAVDAAIKSTSDLLSVEQIIKITLKTL
jgi:hypothetical protein